MDEIKDILKAVDKAEHIVITSHRSPDGDSIGSSLGWYRFLKKIGKNPVICHPDSCPQFLTWMLDGDPIETFEADPVEVEAHLMSADLIFCLDYNASGRLGTEMGDVLDAASAPKIRIDHHPGPSLETSVSMAHPEVCSTSQLVLECILQSEHSDKLDARIGGPLYLGMVTDTGSFRFSSVDARTHELVAELIRCGVNHSEIHEKTFDTNRLEKLKLRGYAIAEKTEIVQPQGVAIISLTKEDLDRFNYQKGDTEGLVNVALSIEGVDVSVFLMEKEGEVKMSFRSLGSIPVNELARIHFNGGGHLNAAGGRSEDSLSGTIDQLKTLIPEFF